jgi:hypothetical protein
MNAETSRHLPVAPDGCLYYKVGGTWWVFHQPIGGVHWTAAILSQLVARRYYKHCLRRVKGHNDHD